jgi:DNA topoisomerase-1
MKLYKETSEDEHEQEEEAVIPALNIKQPLYYTSIQATQKYNHTPPRYTEASLVKKLEELGIGRPSTYAPIISTIQQRGYVIKASKPPSTREIINLTLKNKTITEKIEAEKYGYEKNKLVPTDTGIIVNDYLIQVFPEIMEYNFTANIEKKLDEIAEGKVEWVELIKDFYTSFHPKILQLESSKDKVSQERLLGIDPQTGLKVFAKYGKYGPIIQLGESSQTEKPKFASLKKDQLIETITLQEALELFKIPRNLGQYNGSDVIVNIGKFGPYVLWNKKFYSLKKNIDDPYTITFERAIEIIVEKENQPKGPLREFSQDKELFVLKGRYGIYIKHKDSNYKIPKNFNWETAPYEDFIKIIQEPSEKKKK